MLYGEFIEGTGCKDSEYNYNVYKELEIIYMNTDCTKQHIYEMGMKLVDNSKSEEQIAFEAKINAEINEHKEEIKQYKEFIKRDKESLEYWKADGDKDMIWRYSHSIKYFKEQIREHRNKINGLKWVLA